MNKFGKALRRSSQCGVLLALVFLGFAGCRPAQIGADEATFNTVDALYTAVCSKRSDLVDQCERELDELKAQNKIPAQAHASLAAIIAETRQDRWQPAAQQLSRFMEGQRRE
jgi:hypothetical protein